MVEKVLKVYECDVCGEPGERYVIQFPEGTLMLDRDERHAGAILKLRDQKGAWTSKAAGSRSAFKISSPEEIKDKMK